MTMKTSFGTYDNVYLRVGKFAMDHSMAIFAYNRQEGAIAQLTVCLCDRSLEENEAYVDTNNCPWALDFIEEQQLGKRTGRMRRSGYCTYPAVRFDLKKMKECGMKSW